METQKKDKLRGFYADLVTYIIVNIVLFFLWALFGAGAYWPIWVTIIWGSILLVQAASIGFVMRPGFTLPFLKAIQPLKSFLPFLEDDWKGADLKETSKAVVGKLEKVGLETAKSASAAATKAASKTATMAQGIGNKATGTATKAVKSTSKVVKKAAPKTQKTSKKSPSRKGASGKMV